MKYLFLIIITALAISPAHAQVHANDNLWYNNGAEVFIGSSTLLTVQGDVTNNKAGVTGITHFANNGFVWVQGNMYGDAAFKQSGTGTVRLQNKTGLYIAPYASESYQVIKGGYQIHGDQSATGNATDGSFYNLELDNSAGAIFVTDTTDVRNAVNFKPATVSIDGVAIVPNGLTNTIKTYNPGTSSTPNAAPANGADYTGIFGMMNNAGGMGNFINCSSNLTTNTNTLDSGYVQGKLRRAVNAVSGGAYGFPIGLESNNGTANARGIQYARLDFTANNYNVITGYFQQGSSNTVTAPVPVCNISNLFSFYGASNHGEWVFKPSTVSSETYSLTIYPQDYGATSSSLYFITKDDLIPALAVQTCGNTPLGLFASQLSGFSEFGFGGGSSSPLPVLLERFDGKAAAGCNASLEWKIATVKDLSHFIVLHSNDGKDFSEIGEVSYDGRTIYNFMYQQNQQDGYYRLSMIDNNKEHTLSDIIHVKAECGKNAGMFSIKPNPVFNTLYIDNLGDGIKQLFLIDMLGKTIYTSKTSDKSTSINMQSYPAGIYNLKVADEKGVINTAKISKHNM